MPYTRNGSGYEWDTSFKHADNVVGALLIGIGKANSGKKKDFPKAGNLTSARRDKCYTMGDVYCGKGGSIEEPIKVKTGVSDRVSKSTAMGYLVSRPKLGTMIYSNRMCLAKFRVALGDYKYGISCKAIRVGLDRGNGKQLEHLHNSSLYCWPCIGNLRQRITLKDECRVQHVHRYENICGIFVGKLLCRDMYRSPSLLGYFLQPIFACDDDILERPQFMYISDEVKELQETNRGTIDASLSFLEDQIHDEAIELVGSSNGYLLCCVNTHYIICNPVTREWKTLPEPHKSYEYAPLAFVCRGANDSSLDGITFEIFRVGVSNPRELATTLDMEIFSSLTNEWRESSFIPDSPFLLVVANVPAFVFGDVILWRDMRNKLVAYNRAEECVQVLDLPWNDDDNKYLGLSEGKIHYARLADKGHYFEMWVLEDYRRIESESAWMMKYRLSFDTICKENPRVRIRKNYVVALEGYNVGIEGFHPFNSQVVILINFDGKPYWFDLESCNLKEFKGYKFLMPSYFPYECSSSISEA
ncbi:hypothetical protein ACH5RR_037866 [Cinchona calisaya]|uniref:F-box protein At3g26010-like beta-propeller domain-containing protein n=1 Tax=Cinchona calisaya TaxID=153742 RepID=A0ABD2YC42_9GENT